MLWLNMRRALPGILTGIATGTILAVLVMTGPIAFSQDLLRACYVAYHFLTTGKTLTESLSDTIGLAVWQAALEYSVMIAAFAVPLWVALGRFGRNKAIDAIVLGAAIGVMVTVADHFVFASKISFVGAVAGFMTWVVAQRTLRAPILMR